MKTKTGILLIHGAGLGSYIWEGLSPKLDLPAVAVDFPDRNEGKHADKNLTFDDYAAAAVEQAADSGFDRFYIAAHSIGGLIGLRLASHFGDRVCGFAAISAAIPRCGGSFVSCLPFPQSKIMPLLLRMAGTLPPESAIKSGLCNHLTPEQTRTVVDRYTAESKALFLQKCNAGIPSVPRLYVHLTDDREFSAKMQHKMAANLGTSRTEQLHSGHLPMLTHPTETAALLNRFCTTS